MGREMSLPRMAWLLSEESDLRAAEEAGARGGDTGSFLLRSC
jgi:hypothetical protein